MWRILSVAAPGGMGKSGCGAKPCLQRRQVVPDRYSHKDWRSTEDPGERTYLYTRTASWRLFLAQVIVGNGWTVDAQSWKYTGTQENTVSWGSRGAEPSLETRSFHFIHPKQYGAFPRRMVLPYSYGEILSGYEKDVSSIRDGFTAWVKSDPETILRRHIVDVTRAYAAFRETPARKHSPFCQEYHFNKDIPNRLTEQTRLSVYNWKPRPRRGNEGAIARQIAVKWHIITL